MIGKLRLLAAISVLLGVFAAPGTVVAQDPPKYAREYRQTFKGLPENEREFFFFGPDAAALVKFEAEGLRFKLPAGHGNGTDIGLMTRFGVAGDFEITLKYEVLQELDDAGAQMRFSLKVSLEKNRQYHASVGRQWAGGSSELLTWMTVPALTPGNQDTKVDTFPAKAKTGKLRLTRRGAELSYFAAEADDANFKLLRKDAFGADNLRNIRIVAATGGPKAAADVRVTDFSIRAAAFPRLDKIAAQEAKPIPKDAPTYHESFKGQPQKREDFVLIGKTADKHVKFEPEGLRVTLRAGTPTWQPTGVATAFGIAGDFEVTVRYEVLAEPEPADAGSPNVGTRISLTANVGGININDASLMRTVSPFSAARVAAYTSADKLVDGFPFNAKTGRLRLVRTGDLVAYYLAEGLDKEFKLLTTHAFDAAEVKDIQISAQASGPRAALDVRFTDLQIRAASLTRTLKYAVEYREPFKGPPKKAKDFTLIGAEAPKRVKYEADGLRITMPPGSQNLTKTGVATKFGVAGDFEITVGYEILEESSIALSATLDRPDVIDPLNPKTPIAIDAAMRRNKGGGEVPQFIQIFTTRLDAVRISDRIAAAFSVKEKSGRFRLVRTGARITYYLSEGLANQFTLLATHPFGVEDLKDVQIWAETGNAKASLDVRFTDLHIRAASLPRRPYSPKTGKENDPTPAPKSDKTAEPQVPTKDYAQTYEQSFKGNGTKPAGWQYTAPAAEESVQFEATGLRLIMPAGHRGERRGAGIQTAFGVKGDFEITLNFEFLQEPAPSEFGKFATRLLMGIALDTPNFDTPTAEVATLNRSLLTKGERTFTTWMRNRDNPQGALGGRPTTGSTGRLRLVRSGDELYCAVSLGADQPFGLIKKYRFGTENVKRVAITGMTGHEKAMLDVRITDFSIRADAILGLPVVATAPAGAADAPAQSPDAHESKTALLLVGIMIPLLGIGALAAWFFLARRGTVASPASTVSTRAPISFSCSNCAKPVRANAATAGKKVKCPRCRTVVLVPAPSDQRH